MNATQALAKARKILGPKAAIQVRKSVPVGEERLAEVARRRVLTENLKTLTEARDARRAEVLKADAEYQRLKTEVAAVEKARDSLHGDWSRRVTIVTQTGWANRVEAEGDNFDEAIDELTRKRAGREAA